MGDLFRRCIPAVAAGAAAALCAWLAIVPGRLPGEEARRAFEQLPELKPELKPEMKPELKPELKLPAAPETVAAGAATAFAAKGTELCIRCHRSEQSEWVDVATTKTWRHDAHSRAHLALSPDNPRTRAMEQSLGIAAARTAACVACHTHPAGEPSIEEETAAVHAGISCETCHGAGSGYFEPHMEKRWRFLSTADKESLGMHDLRNPVRKAENCLGCHLGDVPSGKVITHAMYAAGHPPLPAFEMESFGAALGPHWKRVWEKSPQVQAAAAAAGYHTEAAGELHRSLIGGLVSLGRTAEIVRDYAAAAEAKPRAAAWPELALYDCQACHHELRVPSWRQEAGYGGLVPGRPSLVRAPRGLAAVGFAAAGMPTDVDVLMGPFRDALNVRPFGGPDRVRATTVAPRERIGEAIRGLEAVRRDDALAVREHEIVLALAAAGGTCGDFESARQLAWPLVAALGRDSTWTPEERAAVVRRLSAALSLGFPQPAYPEPGAAARPFWQSSVSAAGGTDMNLVHEAFQLPRAVR
jgi:hypothetical protein